MSAELHTIIRWLHVLAGAAWFGEVVIINFVLIPALSKYEGSAKKDFLNTIFPRIFKLSSVLAIITAATGVLLLYNFIGFDLSLLTQRGTWGWSLLIGGSLGVLLTFIHFFLENLLEKKIGIGNPDLAQDTVEDIHLKMKFIPRLGMVIVTVIFAMMMNATHAWIIF